MCLLTARKGAKRVTSTIRGIHFHSDKDSCFVSLRSTLYPTDSEVLYIVHAEEKGAERRWQGTAPW